MEISGQDVMTSAPDWEERAWMYDTHTLSHTHTLLCRQQLNVIGLCPSCPCQVPVPRFAVGIVIGRNGEMIKKIQNDAGVRIQFKAGRSGPEFAADRLRSSKQD